MNEPFNFWSERLRLGGGCKKLHDLLSDFKVRWTFVKDDHDEEPSSQ
jgi:hypothetical protein